MLRCMLPGLRLGLQLDHLRRACLPHPLRQLHSGLLASPGCPPGLGSQHPVQNAHHSALSAAAAGPPVLHIQESVRTRPEGDLRQAHSRPVLLCASQCCAKSCAPRSKPSELIMLSHSQPMARSTGRRCRARSAMAPTRSARTASMTSHLNHGSNSCTCRSMGVKHYSEEIQLHSRMAS